MSGLSLFDKIRLAACAAERAKENFLDNERFNREYETVALWKVHRIYNYTIKTNHSVQHYSLY